MRDEILGTSGLTEADKARLARLGKWWRQVDLASQAGVTIGEVTNIEKGRYVAPERKSRILKALGLLDDKNTSTKHQRGTR